MSGPRPVWPVVAAAIAALVASAFHLAMCVRYGRLGFDLQYDDVTYALDAAHRLDVASASGAGALLRDLVQSPPHSPLMTAQAMLAFATGGLHDVALYASNAWILVAASVAIALVLRGRGVPVTVLALAALLTSPLAYAAIAEFRPDLALGFLTAAMLWMLVARTPLHRARDALPAGVLLGACLLAKPTFFAHTLALAAAACGALVMMCRIRRHAWATDFAMSAAAFATVFAVGIAIALPYFGVGAAHVFDYFWSNTLGANRDVWGSPPEYSAGDLLLTVRDTRPRTVLCLEWAMPTAPRAETLRSRIGRTGSLHDWFSPQRSSCASAPVSAAKCASQR